ncbi:MAG TPA: TusE/DsrC/DsvC family sulfur relay protein, partial [Gammaproteobacteria bacterium]|nr:TusE/DsrC/DsvC family sulfur relay protein [Gammaproteobacteria bacterium]
MDLPARDGDGYLQDMNNWSPEVARAMAAADGFDLTDD